MDNNILLKIKYIILKHIETSQQDNIICVAPQAKNIEFEKKKTLEIPESILNLWENSMLKIKDKNVLYTIDYKIRNASMK